MLWPYVAVISDAVIDQQLAEGEYDEEEFESRMAAVQAFQSWGSLASGLGAGVLIGGIQTLGSRSTGGIKRAVIIAAVAWFVLYTVPAVKYPASPMAMFDEDAANEYYPMYYGYTAVSGLAALGIALVFRRVKVPNKMLGMGAAYLVAMAIAYLVFPTFDMDAALDQRILDNWRALVSLSMTVMWLSAGAIAGLLWKFGSTRIK